MKISLKWLGDHVDLFGVTLDELDRLLTFAGVEVEGIEQVPDKVVVCQVLSSEKHPDADRLSVCQVEDGTDESPRQIVCGAKNYQVGDKVPLALPGCVMPGDFKIKVGKLRGVASHGMMCSGKELGLGDDHDGLLILPADLEPGTPLSEIHPAVFDLEITPNRPDLLSVRGLAREVATLLDRPLKDAPGTSAIDATAAPAGEVAIDAESHCPFYSALHIRGVVVGPSPDWLRDHLIAVGLRPINNVVDITNYVLLETGQPLHAFDAAKVDGGIVVRLASKKEKFLALDGETYELSDDDVVIADGAGNALALGGVMGGEDSGVTEATTDLILESAYFTPPCIRRTSRDLGLSSDSSYRFERGVDPDGVLPAARLAARLIGELAGGNADKTFLTAGATPSLAGTVELDEDRARALLGADLPSDEMHRILTGLGLELESSKGATSSWAIPSFRLDLQRHIDLVEEVARVTGLDAIPATLNMVPSELSDEDRRFNLLADLRARLGAQGFFEIRTIKLISRGRLDDHVPISEGAAAPVALKNPLSDEHTLLRPGLLPGLLEVAERNVHQGAASLRLFEAGTVFETGSAGAAEREASHLGLLLGGAAAPPSWVDSKPGTLDFFEVRGVLQSLFPHAEVRFQPVEEEKLVLAAAIEVDGRIVGRAGQLPPARARAMDFKAPLYFAELDLAAAGEILSKPKTFSELDRFPAVTRDIAMEVPADLPNIDLENFFRARREEILESSQLFDVFVDKSGEKLAANKKSLAYSLTYRDRKATLTAETVDETHAKILSELVKELPVQIR